MGDHLSVVGSCEEYLGSAEQDALDDVGWWSLWLRRMMLCGKFHQYRLAIRILCSICQCRLILTIWSIWCCHLFPSCCLWGHRPEAGGSFSMFLRFGFMCVVVHVHCWRLARLNGGGWGEGNNVPTDCNIRLFKTCFRSVHVRWVDALPGWTGGWGEEGLRRPYGISQSVFPVPRALILDSAISQPVLQQVLA